MAEPFPESLCHRCRWVRRVENKRGSAFLMCTEPSLPRYQSQPIRQCRRFEIVESNNNKD